MSYFDIKVNKGKGYIYMKKILQLIIILTLFLVGCSSSEKGIIKDENLAISNSETTLRPPRTISLTAIATPREKIDINDVFKESDIVFLNNLGISVFVGDEFIKSNQTHITLKFKNKNGDEITKEVPIYFNENQTRDIEFYWGSVSIADNDLIITTKNEIEIYNIDDFEKKDFELNFDIDRDMDIHLVSTIENDDGYYCIYFDEESYKYFNLSKDLEVLNDSTFMQDGEVLASKSIYGYYGYKTYSIPRKSSLEKDSYILYGYNSQLTLDGLEFHSSEDVTFDFSNNSYYIENMDRFSNSYFITNIDAYHIVYSYFNDTDMHTVKIYENHILINELSFQNKIIPSEYLSPYYSSGQVPLPTITYENNILTISYPTQSCDVIVNFNKGTAEAVLTVTKEKFLEDEFSKISHDGRYYLNYANSNNQGGLGGLDNMAVYDSYTDNIYHIAEVGGVMRYVSEIYFLENNDIYVSDFKYIDIYYENSNFQNKLRIDDVFLESENAFFDIYLVENGYYLLFANISHEMRNSNENTDILANDMYMIAKLDNNGKVEEIYKTESPIYADDYGFYDVFLEKEDGNFVIQKESGTWNNPYKESFYSFSLDELEKIK